MFGRGVMIAASVVALDHLVKWAIRTIVMDPPRVIHVTPFFDLVLNWNRGISFGLFGDLAFDKRWMIVAVAIVVTLVLLWWLRTADRPLLATAIGLVIGGAGGHTLDPGWVGAGGPLPLFPPGDHNFPPVQTPLRTHTHPVRPFFFLFFVFRAASPS